MAITNSYTGIADYDNAVSVLEGQRQVAISNARPFPGRVAFSAALPDDSIAEAAAVKAADIAFYQAILQLRLSSGLDVAGPLNTLRGLGVT